MNLPILSLITFTPLVGALVIGRPAVAPRRPDPASRARLRLVAWVLSLGCSRSPSPSATAASPPILMIPTSVAGAFTTSSSTKSPTGSPPSASSTRSASTGCRVLMVLLTTTLTWISILASFGPIKDRVKGYMISFLVLEVGMIGVFVALDLFLFYIFWEIVLVPMYLIIGIWGGANRIYATMKFVLYTLVGSLLMLVAILATAFAYQVGHGGSWAGAFDYQQLQAYAASRPLRATTSRSAPSWRSSSPSRSRSRCSRSTPGCRTPTPRRRPPVRSSSPASCSSSAPTA